MGTAVPPVAAPDRPVTAVSRPDELVRALESEPRLAALAIRMHGPACVEASFAEGSIVFAWPALWRDRGALEPHLLRSRAGYAPLVLLGSDAEFAAAQADRLRDDAFIVLETLPLGLERLRTLFRNLREECRFRREAAAGELLADRYRYEIDEINAIGRALATERDIDKLLALILEKLRQVTHADAGSVYVVEGEDEDVSRRTLRFKVAQNDTVKLDFSESVLPVSPQSIVGRCVLSRQVINIPDLYRLDAPGTGNNPWGFRHNRQFDETIGYQTRSMLAVPMIDAHDQVIGVVQLINRRRRPEVTLSAPEDFERHVVPFDPRSQDIAATLASQAAIALENALLYDDIQKLFEGFVRASVTAIEQRDPTTSGHSQRVADLTVALARATDRVETGPYASFRLTYDHAKQIEYAALLHDFGKVGVRENVLVKSKKLYESDRELILARFDYIRKTIQVEHAERKLRSLLEASREEALAQFARLDAEMAERLREIDDFVAFVLKANEPTVLEQGGFERLADIAARRFRDERGEEQPYLRPHEVEALQLLRGSLTPRERLEIESHVTHTYNFLKRIPWGRSFRDIPEIAGAHHEKLDGSGYPRRLKAEAIVPEARMMTISDMYDALTASDRPYKRAVPVEKALDIIGAEVKAGKCDPELYRIFVEAKIYERVTLAR